MTPDGTKQRDKKPNMMSFVYFMSKALCWDFGYIPSFNPQSLPGRCYYHHLINVVGTKSQNKLGKFPGNRAVESAWECKLRLG